MFERPLLPRRYGEEKPFYVSVEWGNELVARETYRQALLGVVLYRLFGWGVSCWVHDRLWQR